MSNQQPARSSMTPYGYQRNSCGYCDGRAAGRKTSASYYASSNDMRPEHYQELADRGWRRSGSTYYKPDLKNACCPNYTIRLDADAFCPRQTQRKAVNMLNKHITGQDYKRLTARLAPRSRTEKHFRRNNWDLDVVVHEAEYSRLAKPINPKSGAAVEPAHKFDVTLEPDSFTDEKYALFENYQRLVHREPPSKISKRGFRSFLCSGFPQSNGHGSGEATSSEPDAQQGSGKRLGSYHQCYRLDGKLVALGVLDLLPHAVSSVYLLYHESVAEWQFGKVSAMQEIALARESGYRYYYMGFYINSCIKMKYKMEYRPQLVLDGLSYEWHPADQDFFAGLDRAKFVAYIDGKWSPQQRVPATAGESSADAGGDGTIWTTEMPGVLSIQEVAEGSTPGQIQARAETMAIPMVMILGDQWDTEKMLSGTSIQSVCAEMIACLGLPLLDKIALDLGPYFGS